ncbi:uncharacterized protein AB675_9055 [Cyphellophora attinorum]|uniref:Uncharacterized protein n=1 Tax=Cyphellophora attinorum TaxID=1664694 RepID=A0A0N1HCB9_9EURO|nr:uncharacterized protein AB675_9055 [Phialophora attinorum]KPI41390.1 hypothetical protein AB675_9055 [Phialophora attinorum]
MASEDVEMSDITETVLHYDSYTSFPRDEGMRSPRTPTWAPSVAVTPFDFDKYFPRTPLPPSMRKATIPPPPEAPLPWIWQCHLCRNRYPLGVTRRCLYDGHYYCSGETNVKNLKKKKKGQACSSEFDYEGWDEYGEWKREALAIMGQAKVLKRCDKCDFPSMCRTPPEQFPVKKEKKSPPPVAVLPVSPAKKATIELDFQLPSADELAALEKGEKEELLLAAGASLAKADRSVDFAKILQEGAGKKQTLKQSKVTDMFKGKTKKDKAAIEKGLSLSLEPSKSRKSGEFVMPSLDIWGKGSKK